MAGSNSCSSSSPYTYHLCIADGRYSFKAQEDVFVNLRSDRDTGRAVVLATPDTVAPAYAGRYQVRWRPSPPPGIATSSTVSSPVSSTGAEQQYCQWATASSLASRTVVPTSFPACATTGATCRCPQKQHGYCRVQYTCDSSLTYHVRPARLCRVSPRHGPCVLICATTAEYRRLAGSQVTQEDRVLELGSSYGLCTKVLARQAADVLGIDNSPQAVAAAKAALPDLNFLVLDVLEHPGEMKQLGQGRNVVFVDIGGNRELQPLLRLLPWLQQELQPQLIVVKSEELAAAAQQHLEGLLSGAPGQQLGAGGSVEQQSGSSRVGPAGTSSSTSIQPAAPIPALVVAAASLNLETPPACHQQQQQGHIGSSSSIHHPSVAGQQPFSTGGDSCSCQHNQQPDSSPPQCVDPSAAPQVLGVDLSAHQVSLTWVDLPEGATWWQQLQALAAAAPLCHISSHHQQQQPGVQGDNHHSHQQQQVVDVQAPSQGGNTQQHKAAEPWYLLAKQGGFTRHPLRYPQRFTPCGVRICRPYNYSTCLKADTCPFDHLHCHHCGEQGHRAEGCPLGT